MKIWGVWHVLLWNWLVRSTAQRFMFPKIHSDLQVRGFSRQNVSKQSSFLNSFEAVGGRRPNYSIYNFRFGGSKEYFGEAALRALPDAFLDDAQAIAEPAQPVKRGSSAWCFGGASPSTWAQAINLRKIDQIQSGLNQSHSLRWYGMRWHEYVWVYKQ